MFGKSAATSPAKSEARPNRIDSLIGPGTTVEGNIRFVGGLRIEGEIKGDVNVDPSESGVLMLGNSGVINGNVRVSHLVVDGTINGNVYVSEAIELSPTARIFGDIEYGGLEMHMGATVQGSLKPMAKASQE